MKRRTQAASTSGAAPDAMGAAGPQSGGRERIEGALTIYDATEAKARLLEALRREDRLEVDLAGVSEIDTAGLQVLVLLKREAMAGGKELLLVGHSLPVLEVMDLCGLSGYFGDPLVIPSKRVRRQANPRRRRDASEV